MLKVTCSIILRQNKIFVTQCNSCSDHPLKWEFPGGKIKENESVENCITREISEELEIEIEILEPMITVQYDYGFRLIELIPFLCILKSGQIKLNVHNDFKWVTLKNLKEIDFAEADRKLIQLNENQKILKKYLGKNKYDSR